jgi:SAM-dependent methyltransferase
MGDEVEIVTPLHKSTKRDYIQRMIHDKVECIRVAKQYGVDYWDGDRKYGYGGYRYIEGYWLPVAQALIKKYELTNESKILDVGCGKAFLLYEITKLLPGISVAGLDISQYGIDGAKEDVRPYLHVQRAQDPYEWEDGYFDLVISLACFHNLRIFELEAAVKEVERVGGKKFIMAESYRNEQELFNVQCWALTCESWLDREEWIWLFRSWGYTGDYEFIYFE